ncbi:MAG: hypothetical protein J6V38_05315 [Kiritimatiellae bacterium]|nr:hypothetical protein [Kiritimatiellia bacterium]
MILGLFRGASGFFSFVSATIISIAAGIIAWPYAVSLSDQTSVRYFIVIVGSLLAFGLVRVVVKKVVNGLLSQPADSIFGFLIGAAASLMLLYIAANIPKARDVSIIARESYELIKAGGYDR